MENDDTSKAFDQESAVDVVEVEATQRVEENTNMGEDGDGGDGETSGDLAAGGGGALKGEDSSGAKGEGVEREVSDNLVGTKVSEKEDLRRSEVEVQPGEKWDGGGEEEEERHERNAVDGDLPGTTYSITRTFQTRKRTLPHSPEEDASQRKVGRNVTSGRSGGDGVEDKKQDKYCWVCHRKSKQNHCRWCSRSYPTAKLPRLTRDALKAADPGNDGEAGQLPPNSVSEAVNLKGNYASFKCDQVVPAPLLMTDEELNKRIPFDDMCEIFDTFMLVPWNIKVDILKMVRSRDPASIRVVEPCTIEFNMEKLQPSTMRAIEVKVIEYLLIAAPNLLRFDDELGYLETMDSPSKTDELAKDRRKLAVEFVGYVEEIIDTMIEPMPEGKGCHFPF